MKIMIFYLNQGDVYFCRTFWQNDIGVDGISSDAFLITKPMWCGIASQDLKDQKAVLECISDSLLYLSKSSG